MENVNAMTLAVVSDVAKMKARLNDRMDDRQDCAIQVVIVHFQMGLYVLVR